MAKNKVAPDDFRETLVQPVGAHPHSLTIVEEAVYIVAGIMALGIMVAVAATLLIDARPVVSLPTASGTYPLGLESGSLERQIQADPQALVTPSPNFADYLLRP